MTDRRNTVTTLIAAPLILMGTAIVAHSQEWYHQSIASNPQATLVAPA